MKVTICRLMRDGMPDRDNEEAIEGDLNLGMLSHPVLVRSVTMLHLIDGQGRQPVAPLMDAVCYSIAARGMWWRGIEVSPQGRQQAQEWFVKPLP